MKMANLLFLAFISLFSVYILAYLVYFIFVAKNLGRDYGVSRDVTYRPNVSLIICAYNEEKTIASKIKNTLEIEYPRDKLEIIVFDNGSQDGTYDVAKSFAEEEIKVYKLNGKNKGKSAGLNVAFKYAKGDIVVISDVDCLLKKNVLIESMPYFADAHVGTVTGSQILLNPNESPSARSELSLQSYYKFIRKAESIMDSTIIYNGEFAAFRKNLIRKLDEDIAADDTQIAMEVRKAGYRALFLEEVNFFEYAPSNLRAKWEQKVRRSAAVVQVLIRYKDFMFNRKYGVYGTLIYPWNFFMHVISPFLFASLLAISFFLLVLDFYSVIKMLIAMMFMVVIMVTIIHAYFEKSIRGVVDMIFAFVHAQLTLLIGSLSLIRKNPYKWEPVRDTRRY